jgi:hypothetical protein
MNSKRLDLALDSSHMVVRSDENDARLFNDPFVDEVGYVFRGKQTWFVKMYAMRPGG